MSATLHTCIHYGYLLLSEDVEDFLALNPYLPEPFYIACLLPELSLDVTSLDEIPIRHVVFGVPIDTDVDIEQLLIWRSEIDAFVTCGMLEAFQFASQPRFYSGIPWIPSESESEFESESESESEFESESEEEDEESM
jgi:hypothetical protein